MEVIIMDQSRLKSQLENTRAERDKEHEKFNEISTKYALGQAKISNQEKYITKIEEDLKTSDKQLSLEK